MAGAEILEGHGPRIEPPAFTDAEYERRLAAVRRLMAERDLDAFLAFTPENIYYLTGHDTPGYHWFQASVVTHDRRPINVLRRIETNNTLGRSWARLAVGFDDHGNPVETTLAVLDELGLRGKRIGAEAHAWFVTPERFEALGEGIEAAGGSFVRSGLLSSSCGR